MRSLLTLPADRRAIWALLAAWLLIALVAGTFAGKFQHAQTNQESSYLPAGAESVRALDRMRRFASGETAPAAIVYHRAGGLTGRDRAAIASDRARLDTRASGRVGHVAPAAVAPGGATALLVAPISTRHDPDGTALSDAVTRIRTLVHHAPPGLAVKVGGGAGSSADATEVFSGLDSRLLLVTAGVVFLLLVAIYRSPIFWLLPLVSVGIAELAARGAGYGLTQAGVVVNGQSAGILTVLVFGAGTDYALLLVARYREELRRHADRHVAMAEALRRAGPAILASGATVIAALLCMTAAQVNSTSGVGPIAAVGIALAMLAMLTLLPALLMACGRRAFWPFIPRAGSEVAGADRRGFWTRVGARVAAHPARVSTGVVALLAVMALGLADLSTSLPGAGFRNAPESEQAQTLISRAFPGGASSPTTVIVPDPARAHAAIRALRAVPGVASARAVERGAPGVRAAVTLRFDPSSDRARALIPRLRAALGRAGAPRALVGGPTAESHDYQTAAARDDALIIPVVLAVVFVILVLVLRSLVAAVMLIATVALSFAAALGICEVAFDKLFHFAGSEPSLPLFTFIFLVALGVDYNIFLMIRVREEALRAGTRQGILRGLQTTGAVITSAGVVLAATFSALASIPLVAFTEIGAVIAFGVLLDTFLVRSLLVPALGLLLGERLWAPWGLSRSRAQAAVPAGSAP